MKNKNIESSLSSLALPYLLLFSFSLFVNTYASESTDFILIDDNFAGSESLGQNENEDYEEATLIEIQHLGESNNFIESSSYCGNNQIEENEQCDGSNFNGKTCNSLGFTGGTLSCSSSCQTISTSNCISPTPTPLPTIIISTGGSGGGGGGGGYIPTATPEPLHSSAQTPTPETTPTLTPIPTSTTIPNETTAPINSPIPTENPIASYTPQIIYSPNPEPTKKISNIGSLIEIDDNQNETNNQNKQNKEEYNNEKIEEIENDDEEIKSIKGSNKEEFIPQSCNQNKEKEIENDDEKKRNGDYFSLKNSAPEQREGNISYNENIPCCVWILLAFLLGFFTRHFLGYFFDRKEKKYEKIE